MALIKCVECGNGVSDKATHCPKCGSRGIYDGRKISHEINRKSEKPVNHKRVERIMRENSIRSKSHKKYKATTNSRLALSCRRHGSLRE